VCSADVQFLRRAGQYGRLDMLAILQVYIGISVESNIILKDNDVNPDIYIYWRNQATR
jgi:hypothetical protein